MNGLKQAQRWFYYRLAEGTFFIFFAALRSIPPKLFHRLCEPLIRQFILCVVSRRRILKNITAAFGESYSPATKRGLAKGVQQHLAKNLLDCLLQLADPEHTHQSVTIEGLQNLEAALAKGKGVIALGAHIGNFVLVGTRLGTEGYPFSTIFRIPKDPRIEKAIQHYLPRFCQHVIPSRPTRAAIRHTLAVLKNNEIVFILGDNFKKGKGKVRTFLFGQRVHFPRGPISLALRSGAALVPMYLIRNYQGSLHLVIEPEILLIRSGNVYEDITGNTRQIVRYLENLIGRYPDQWNWLTVRLRKRPGQPAPADTVETQNECYRDPSQRDRPQDSIP